MIRRGIFASVLAGILLAMPVAQGMFMPPTPVPVERLIKNVTAYTTEHPKDAEGFYILGRLNYLAFHLNSSKVGIFGKEEAGKLPPVAANDMQGNFIRQGEGPEATTLPADQRAAHVRDAVLNFRKAIEMSPDNAVYHLGLASVLFEASAMAEQLGVVPGDEPNPDREMIDLSPEAVARREADWRTLIAELGAADFKTRENANAKLKAMAPRIVPFLVKNIDQKDPEVKARITKILVDYWLEKAIPEYLKAYQLAVTKDLEIEDRPINGLQSLVTYEAGQRYRKLVVARGPTDVEKEQVAKIEKDLKALDSKPMIGVTPIIFNIDRPAELSELLAPEKTSRFDLDGTARPQACSWVKPTTAILAWDSEHTGTIHTGHQLFGSVSFNMIWSDGYRALDALDDNRDGMLSGSELAGLALWFDRDGNGKSDTGEVVPIEKTEIAAIRVRPDMHVAGAAAAVREGLLLRDGRSLPTYDWVPTGHTQTQP